MKHFDEFKLVWEENFKQNRNRFPHLFFIAVYPDKLKWDFGVEKQTQTTCLHISGGPAGAGSGHTVKLLYQSELYDFLKTCTQTHAMIVTVGMVFEMTASSTAISEFHEFSKSKKFCKAHIIARPNQPAWLHPQHIELNLDKWKELGCPDLSRKRVWNKYIRAEQNYHDDYTPFWLKPKGVPRIHNFNIEERKNKAFSYGHMEERRSLQNETWSKLRLGKFDEVDHEDNYFSRLMTRMKSTYYLVNYEKLKLRYQHRKSDIIICPTAGYTGEVISDIINFDGEIIFYDYTQDNIDIKRDIVEMNMSKSELKYYITKVKTNSNFDIGNQQNWDLIDSYREQQRRMVEKYDIDYWVMNLIEPDYDKLLKKVKSKRVYFNASNIFSYHITYAMYTYEKLLNSFKELIEILAYSDGYFFRGATPNKKWIYIDENTSS